MSQKEEVSRKIQNKVGSAAAVYSACLRNMPLKELDPTIMANVVGIVALLGTAPTHTLSRVLAEYLGEDQMLAIVRQSSAAVTPSENYERPLDSAAAELGMPINGSHLLICLEDIRVYPRGVIEGDPQKRLALPKPALSDGTTPPGFLGYAVNMIEIDADHLQTKTAAGHGLRETLFYRLFGNLQVYDTKEHMEEAHGCISDGAVSLDGGIVRGNGIISVGCKQVDVHFPVVALEHRMVVFPDKPDIKALIGKKETAEKAIAFTNKERNTCLKQFQERYAECCKLIEYKEASQKLQLSQESLKFLPRPSQTSV